MDDSLLNGDKYFVDVLVKIERDMDYRSEENLIFAVPETEEAFERSQRGDFKHVLWKRLYSLGYASHSKLVPRRRGKKLLTTRAQYSKAVKAFQREAGTQPDGWVGLETWESMQELFTFEHDSNLEKWFQPRYKKILYRATHLRLIMLGLINTTSGSKQASGNHEAVAKGLTLWRHIITHLSPADFNRDTDERVLIELLFDIDKLTKLVSDNVGKLRAITALQGIKPQFTHDDSLVFLKSLLKVELWLYGDENIVPGNLGHKHIINYIPIAKRENSKINALSRAVSNFLDEFDVKIDDHIAKDESRLIAKTLKQLAKLDDEAVQAANAKERSELLENRLTELPQNKRREVVVTMKKEKLGIGAWLFDGVKRIFRWLKKSIFGAIKWIQNKAKQLASLISKLAIGAKRIASDAYSFVKRGFKILADGISFALQSEHLIRFKPASHDSTEVIALALRKQPDMDTVVYINPKADPTVIETFWEKVSVMLLRARAAMALVNFIVTEAVKVIRDGIFKGPMAILSLLIRIYKMRNSANFAALKKAYATYEEKPNPAYS